MKKILVIFTGTRDDIEIINRVLEREGENIFIEIVFILSEAIPSNFSTWLMYMGFLGEEPTKEIKDLILKEIERDLIERKKEVEELLTKKGISFKTEFKKGDFYQIVKDITQKEKFDSVYTSKARDVIIGEESLKDLKIKEL